MEEPGNEGHDAGDVEDTAVLESDVIAAPVEVSARFLSLRRAFSAFAYPDYRLLWSGSFLSNVGTWIHMAALFWLVKVFTGSDAWVGAVNLANLAPVLFLSLYAGSLADRLNRKAIIVTTQGVMMLAALTLAVFASFGRAGLPVIMITTTVMGVAFSLNFPAWRAVIPDLVKREDMLNGIALDAAGFNLARFLGPALGALVLEAWGADAAFYINAASFLAVIVGVLLIRTRTPGTVASPGGAGRHIREALSYVWRERWAFNLLFLMGAFSLFGLPYIVLLPGVARDVLGRGSGAYGLMLGATGLGAALSAPLVTLVNRRFSERAIVKACGLLASLLLLAFSFSRRLWLSVLISFFLGSGYLMLSSSVNTVLQSRVEREMRGRIVALVIMVMQGLYPLGGMALGWVADLRSAPLALALGALACLATSVAAVAFPSLLKEAVSPAWLGRG
jgi:MFS family permease